MKKIIFLLSICFLCTSVSGQSLVGIFNGKQTSFSNPTFTSLNKEQLLNTPLDSTLTEQQVEMYRSLYEKLDYMDVFCYMDLSSLMSRSLEMLNEQQSNTSGQSGIPQPIGDITYTVEINGEKKTFTEKSDTSQLGGNGTNPFEALTTKLNNAIQSCQLNDTDKDLLKKELKGYKKMINVKTPKMEVGTYINGDSDNVNRFILHVNMGTLFILCEVKGDVSLEELTKSLFVEKPMFEGIDGSDELNKIFSESLNEK